MICNKYTLDEICKSISDGDHQPPPKSDSGIPFVTIANITKTNDFDFSDTMYVPREYYDSLDEKKRPQVGDILYSVVGSFGIPVYIKKERAFVFQRHIAILRPNTEKVIPEFLYYIMMSKDFYMKADVAAVGAAQRTISLASLRNMEVELPEIDVQKKIVAILKPYDDLIENNQKQIKLLEEVAQRLYKEWFVDLHFPGHENTKIVDGVPEGWNEKTLSQVANVIMGQSPKSEFYNSEKKGLPFHQGVGSYGVRFVMDDIYSTSYTRIAEPNSILFSVRAPVGRLNITKNKVVIGRGLAAINQTDGCQSYLYYLLKNKFFKDNIVGNGSIFASVSKDELLNQKFLIPERNLMMQFEKIVSQMDKQIENLDSKNKKLIEARDRLLPKLMSGEVEA